MPWSRQRWRGMEFINPLDPSSSPLVEEATILSSIFSCPTFPAPTYLGQVNDQDPDTFLSPLFAARSNRHMFLIVPPLIKPEQDGSIGETLSSRCALSARQRLRKIFLPAHVPLVVFPVAASIPLNVDRFSPQEMFLFLPLDTGCA